MEIEDLVVGGEYEYDFYRSGSNWTPVIVEYIGKCNIILSLENDYEVVIKPENLTHIREKKQVVKVANPLSVWEFILDGYFEEEPGENILKFFSQFPSDMSYRLMYKLPLKLKDAVMLSDTLGRSSLSWLGVDSIYQENKGDK